jgi:hypothetical protein
VLATNLDFDFDIGIRPGWVVFGIGLIVIGLAALRMALLRWRRPQLKPA